MLSTLKLTAGLLLASTLLPTAFAAPATTKIVRVEAGKVELILDIPGPAVDEMRAAVSCNDVCTKRFVGWKYFICILQCARDAS